MAHRLIINTQDKWITDEENQGRQVCANPAKGNIEGRCNHRHINNYICSCIYICLCATVAREKSGCRNAPYTPMLIGVVTLTLSEMWSNNDPRKRPSLTLNNVLHRGTRKHFPKETWAMHKKSWTLISCLKGFPSKLAIMKNYWISQD